MEKVVDVLGPWPILQFLFGVAILGFGAYMIVRGTQKDDNPSKLEDRRAEWQAYEQLRNIEENSFKMVALTQKLVEEVQRLTSVIWNRKQF